MEATHHQEVKPREETSEKQAMELTNQVFALLSAKIEESIQRNIPSLYCSVGLPTVEFPKFSGDGFDDWVYKCNEFFELYKIPDDMKVRFASIHLEGKALQRHKEFMEKRESSPILKWEDYTQGMRSISGHNIHRSITNKRAQMNAIPLTENKWPHPSRQICKVRTIDEEEIPTLKESHYRFGPFYSKKLSLDLSFKDEAWQHLLKNSPERTAVTTEIYLSAMREVENEARSAYDDEVLDHMTGPEFRWMMIKDGCFFLQLALYVLGGAEQLGYPPNHVIFGQRNYRYKDFKEWYEAMFFVGNQIPLVVLMELMKQIYFQNVIGNGKWEQPADLCRLALYELLLLPAREIRQYGPLQWLSQKISVSSIAHWLQKEQPCDLLHGLQLLIIGPKRDEEIEEEEDEKEEDKDLESQQEHTNIQDVATDDKISLSATKMKNAGIHFWPLNRMKGSRGIHFSNSMWRCKAFPILYLPPLLVGDDTELMFQCLRNYEITQHLDKSKHEVSSYVLFMHELIRDSDDAKLLGSRGIIQGKHLKHKIKLPEILKRVAPKESYNHNLRRVKFQTSAYSPPLWTQYWHIVSIALIVTILQTVYTILPYYKS